MADLYHSDLHLPRWKRGLLWLLENPLGQALWGIPLLGLAFAPTYWLGIWWPILLVVAGLAFAIGWNAARRKGLQTGRIDPL